MLADRFDDRSRAQRDLAALRESHAVDDELLKLKAEATKAIEPPGPDRG